MKFYIAGQDDAGSNTFKTGQNSIVRGIIGIETPEKRITFLYPDFFTDLSIANPGSGQQDDPICGKPIELK